MEPTHLKEAMRRLRAPRQLLGDELAEFHRAATGAFLPTSQQPDGKFSHQATARAVWIWTAAVEWTCSQLDHLADTPAAPQAANQQAEPTVDMVRAGMSFFHDKPNPASKALEVYRAMRAAAPQAASQQATVKDALRRCGANTDYHGAMLFSVAQFDHFVSIIRPSAPQAATTAACQPSTLTGQPDAAICQPAATTASASQVDPGMALPSRTTAEWAASGCLTPEYMAAQAAKNAGARAALAQLAVDESEGGHHD